MVLVTLDLKLIFNVALAIVTLLFIGETNPSSIK